MPAKTLLPPFCVALLLGSLQAAEPKESPAKSAVLYHDAKYGFTLQLPAGVTKDAEDATGTQVTYSGFPVPKGTNLSSKTLIIAYGKYDMQEGSEAAGKLTVDGVTFQRTKMFDGSAGHMAMHVIYAWKKGDDLINIDFAHKAANVGNYDPADRPKEYDQTAQIKLSEAVMKTFHQGGKK